jgi:predicted dehydrogenase
MPPIRVGIIGLAATLDYAITGAWGVIAHLRSIQALSEEYEIVAVANSSVESAQRSIEFHKLPATTKAYGNPDDISADPNVDLVVVSVKVSDHLHLTKPALENQKSVFVEWPLGASVAEAEELTKLAAARGVKTIVGLQARS